MRSWPGFPSSVRGAFPWRQLAILGGTLAACQRSPAPSAGAGGAPALPTPPAILNAPAAPAPPAAVPQAPSAAIAPSGAGGAPAASTEQLAALQPLICFGNEPFWGVQFKPDGSATCEAMCEGPPGLHVVNVSLAPSGDPQGFDLLDAQGKLFLRGTLRRTNECSDGMSDNLHPYVFSGEGPQHRFAGCCRDKRAPRAPG